jgi:hypothetical protein
VNNRRPGWAQFGELGIDIASGPSFKPLVNIPAGVGFKVGQRQVVPAMWDEVITGYIKDKP